MTVQLDSGVAVPSRRADTHIRAMPAAIADLFDMPILPGLAYREDIIDAAEEAALIAGVDAQALSPFRFQGWLGKRLTTSFGWSYDFDRGSFDQAPPIPDWLLPLKARAAAFAGLADADLIQALLIRYDPGAGIGWHRDRPVFEHVVGISLGVPGTLRFRRRREGGFDRASAPLAPRSIYHLSGQARYEWEHSIAEMDVTRWSITFRSFSEKARQKSAS
jgi:alkylated DNA repair protein (DNA oxidative demethylase)